MIPGFEEGILGHQAGDEFDMKVTFPATYHAKDLAGKEATFKVKVHDVCVRQLPALNSDFAKKAGKVDTMEEYRAQIHDQLAARKRTTALNRARNQIIAMLAEASKGDLPGILVENAYHNEMQSIQQQLQMQRMSLDKYLGQVHQTRDEFKATVHKMAEQNARARMALLQIAGEENLIPTDAELDAQLAQRLRWPKRAWNPSRKRPTCGPCAGTTPSARPPTGCSSTPPSTKNRPEPPCCPRPARTGVFFCPVYLPFRTGQIGFVT